MKYILSLFIALWSIAAWGQEGGDGFNPSNPGEPGQRYNLTVNVIPDGAGNTSPSGKQQYALGESVYLSASANNYYQFVGWEQNGDTISRERYFYYTMPNRNTTITAVFKVIDSFNPDNPDDPSQEVIKYKLMLTASPIEGGSFNISSGERFSEGSSISLRAYPNSNYQFEGWKQGEKLLSTESRYSFVMGKEDVSLIGLFRFNPANPGNPGANHWNVETGELIIDDFTPGSIMNAVDDVIGGSGNRSKVSMVIVSGQMGSYDFGITNYLSNCTLLDLSRTGGYTEIPSYAFDATNLSTVVLPACVEHIGYYAFGNCKNLSDIISYAITPPTVDNRAFEGIADGAVIHVLASAIPLYTEAPVWKDLTILPLTEDVKTLEVNLPADSEGTYKNMTLELQNLQNGQKQRYVVSDRTSYTFNGLLKNCTYNVSLKTPTGVVLGQIENIEIKDENRSVTFTSLLALLDVNLQVLTPDGTDVTNQVQITWLDSKQAYLSQGNLLKAQTAGTEIGYRMVLNQDLGMQYIAPENQVYSVKEKGNRLVYTLTPIETVTVSGIVKEAGGSVLSGATVSVSQKLNGKYSKSFIAQTDAKGKFELQVYNDESTISVSATDYVNQTLTKADFSKGTNLGTIELKTIAGATISLSLTYTPSVMAGTEATTEDWYSDYANIAYSIYNETQQKEITDFSVQYPSIVLLEEVEAGDQLRITASSKNNAFQPVTATATIDETAEKASALLKIIALGGINASYTTTDNTGVVGILYDSKGELIKKYTYSNQSLSINNLSDGEYTLVSMANSTFFNSILKLSQLAASGLVEGTDYVQNSVTVKRGILSSIANSHVPALDESKLYYTGDNTSFTVNKASIVAGNYLTLKGKVDFKEEYADLVSDVQLVVDLPESCSYVENSVMAGNSIASYTLDNNRLTIPLANYTDLVRFCVIPTAGGSYQPNAFVEFILNGKKVSQPIGSAFYEVKDLSISVPSTVAKTTIPISGTAQGNSEISIYDNGILIGQTTSLANGVWATTCELNEPYNLSTHSIYAKITNNQGINLQSETQEVTYNMSAIQPSTVTMTFYNGWLHDNIEVIFDIMKGTTSSSSYMFYTTTDITFIIDFTNNSPDVISDVILNVYTDQNEIQFLKAAYNEKLDKWIAVNKFNSNNLPINVSVNYEALAKTLVDRNQIDNSITNLTDATESEPDMQRITDLLAEEYLLPNQNIYSQIDSLLNTEDYGITDLQVLLKELIGDKEYTTEYDPELLDAEVEELISNTEDYLKEFDVTFKNMMGNFYPNITNDIVKPNEDIEFSLPTSKGSKLISKKTVAEINVDSLFNNGFKRMELTDGSFILYKNTPNTYTYIDVKEKVIYETILSVNSPQANTRIDITSPVCLENIVNILKNIGEIVNNIREQEDAIEYIVSGIEMLDNLETALKCYYDHAIKSLLDEFEQYFIEQQADLSKKYEEFNPKIDKAKSNIGVNEINLVNENQNRAKLSTHAEAYKVMIKGETDPNEIKRLQALLEQCNADIQLSEKNIKDFNKKIKKAKDSLLKLQLKQGKIAQKIGNLTNERGKTISSIFNKFPRELSKASTSKFAKSWGAKLSKFIGSPLGAVLQIIPFYVSCYEVYDEMKEWEPLYSAIKSKIPCEGNEEKAQALYEDIKGKYINHTCWFLSQICAEGGALALDAIPSIPVFSPTWWISNVMDIYAAWCNYINLGNSIHDRAIGWIEVNSLRCSKNPNDPNDSDKADKHTPTSPTTPSSSPIHDPSGYVYEAVETNRLQGVTATCYYKEMVEDMYGDLHENIVLWDATEYAQENPLFTDENGMYAWDVPQGLWQVKFEKEGYQTTHSEWLPVPPPQLEVNIGMVQTAQPTVTAIRGYETGIEIDFSKFMLPETMTAEFITITRNGEAVAGEVTFKNAEANPQNKNEQFVSKVRFVPAEALATTDKVILTVSKRVKSYAGIQMESDYSQEIAIEKEPKAVVASEIEVVYNETAEITVTVDPAEASTGKKVTATSVSSTIAAIEPAEAILNEEGKATFIISGELPGQTMIRFAVEGMDMKPEVKVSVVEAGEKEITRNYTLSMGWNWFSINVQDQNLNDIPALLAPIKESVLILKGQNGELTNKNENDWEGSLNSLSTTQAYKIKMKKEATLELTGKGADPTSNTITLNQGWNWIGYIPTVTLPLEQALQNLQAEENDLIKGLDSFAIYDGSTWTGSLTHLLPGEGYMYYSQSVKSFNYTANGTESEPSTPSAQWSYDIHQSEDNMIAIAELYNGEQKAEIGKFLVGVFVGDECRGIAVEKDGYLFITAHGEQTDGKLALRAFDTADQQEYNVKEEIEWSGTLTGSLTTPVSLHIGEATGITPISEGLLVYPSPVRHRLYIRGDIGNIEEVRISDTAGQTLILDKQVIPNEGINVSSLSKGIYFIIIKTDNEVIQQKFMKID